MYGGYAGKILRVNLTDGKISEIATARYKEFGGGLGIGAAVFWDLCVAPGKWDIKDAFDPDNIITLMSGPLAFAMQGKNRDVEKFSGYMYKPGASSAHYLTTIPVFNGSKWDWIDCADLYLDHDGVEHWKGIFYSTEGWDPQTGNPEIGRAHV